jgi:predicted exporter
VRAVQRRFRLWSALAALLLVLFAAWVVPHLKFETDILALLPQGREDAATAQALDRFADQLGRNAVFLVGAADFDTARKAAQQLAEALRRSPAFAKVQLEVDADWLQQAAAVYTPYRDGLLAPHTRALLESGNEAALLSQARQALYTPAAFVRRSSAGEDPLDLFGAFLASATPGGGQLTLRDGVLVTTDPADGKQYILVRTVLAGNAFSTAEEDAAAPALDAALAAAKTAGATVEGSGLIQHAVAASRLARREVGLFGSVQLLCVIGVLLAVFRSGRVLLLSAAALGLGLVAALSVCQLLFGRVHVLTLVFCSNLAGIAIDYSIYYCADQFRLPGRWRAADALPFIGRAIGMSCLVALMSYALLAVAPFPGLRQMALFCCVGLAVAYACVMAWFPVGVRPAPEAAALRLAGWFERLLRLRERLVAARPLWWFWLPLALATVAGLWRLQTQDALYVLQPDTPELNRQEAAVRQRLGDIVDSQFFLVRATDPQTLLQDEEALCQRLDALRGRGLLKNYSAVSQALPSAARQTQDHSLLARHVFNPGGLSERFMRELGFADSAIEQRRTAFEQNHGTLQPQDWLGTAAAEPFRHLWLGDIGSGTWASVVTLSGTDEGGAVAAAGDGLPGVRYVDRVGDVTEVLRRYRRIALWIVVASVFASAALLAVPYGARRGVRLMAAPVAAALATPAMLGLLGVPMTFFHVVALHLVLGLSMEYAILLQLPELRGPSALLSVTLAALLAFLAFGLLALSATPFIHAIGLTVAIGVTLGFAGALLLGTIPSNPTPEIT